MCGPRTRLPRSAPRQAGGARQWERTWPVWEPEPLSRQLPRGKPDPAGVRNKPSGPGGLRYRGDGSLCAAFADGNTGRGLGAPAAASHPLRGRTVRLPMPGPQSQGSPTGPRPRQQCRAGKVVRGPSPQHTPHGTLGPSPSLPPAAAPSFPMADTRGVHRAPLREHLRTTLRGAPRAEDRGAGCRVPWP